MKTRERILTVFLLLGIALGSCSPFMGINVGAPGEVPYGDSIGVPDLPEQAEAAAIGDEELEQPDGIPAPAEFRGVWVTTVFNLDFPSQQGLSAEAMKNEIDAIVARTYEMGLNAIIFQVRPTGDAFYESDIFPWSNWLSGTQGQGIPGFNPLAYFIDASHAKNIELHAWINPYRIIHTATNSSDPDSLAPNHPVRQRPELAVGWTDERGRRGLFLDPGLPDARQLIIDGIEELIRRYNIDGIHFDDYFYPGTNFDDTETFARYGNGMYLHDWRRENVNTLIRDIQSTIRELNEELDRDVTWGISPTAIWKNQSSNPLGVPTTRGMESYHSLYADTRLWVSEGLVDYIMPQIYWYIGFEIANFEAVLNWWIDLCRDSGVDLIIGHAAWREKDDHQTPRWRGEMIRQLEMLAQSDVVDGSVFFRFYHLRGAVGDAIRNFYFLKDNPPSDREPVMILDTLSIGTPDNNPSLRAPTNERRGFNVTGTSDPNELLFMNGSIVRNRTVEGFFSIHVPLEPGENVFTFTQQGQEPVSRTITRNPPAPVTPPVPTPRITQIETPVYATIVSDSAWLYPRNTTSGGSGWMMNRGQRDRVIAEADNGFVQLSSGMWLRRDHVSIRDESEFIQDVLQHGQYRAGRYYDAVVWQTDVFSGIYSHFDGRVLTVYFGMHTEPPPLSLPANLDGTIFASLESGMSGAVPFHAFTIRDGVRFEGQYVVFENDELRLHMRKRRPLTEGDRPLTGFTFVLDPGHGGDDIGAIGPLGRSLTEADLVLINSNKLYERLVALGAAVHMTRTADVTVPLQARVDLSRQVKPDMFISLHINSVAETTNATNIHGFTVWYRNPGSADFSKTVLDIMYDINPLTNRHRNINQANFFVCRPQWAPHVLLESSFIVNIDDFVWLIDPVQQNRMADATVEAILEYFS